jgi:antitoxin component YwqK of YwqJK toxin-antitoxin module
MLRNVPQMKNILTLILVAFASIAMAQSNDIKVENGKYYSMNGGLFSGLYAQYDAGVKVAELSVEEGVLSGAALYYHTSGNIKEEGSFDNGKRSGNWTQYNDLGQVNSSASYIEDQKHGKWIVWDDAGNKRFEMYYDNGARVGTWKMWSASGELTTKTF